MFYHCSQCEIYKKVQYLVKGWPKMEMDQNQSSPLSPISNFVLRICFICTLEVNDRVGKKVHTGLFLKKKNSYFHRAGVREMRKPTI